jgi:hypothetical protein
MKTCLRSMRALTTWSNDACGAIYPSIFTVAYGKDRRIVGAVIVIMSFAYLFMLMLYAHDYAIMSVAHHCTNERSNM